MACIRRRAEGLTPRNSMIDRSAGAALPRSGRRRRRRRILFRKRFQLRPRVLVTRVDAREFRAEQHDLRRVVDPEQKHGDRPSGPVARGDRAAAEYKPISSFPIVKRVDVTSAPTHTSRWRRRRSGGNRYKSAKRSVITPSETTTLTIDQTRGTRERSRRAKRRRRRAPRSPRGRRGGGSRARRRARMNELD